MRSRACWRLPPARPTRTRRCSRRSGRRSAWDVGAVWTLAEAGTLRCDAAWPLDGGDFVAATRALALAADEGLPGQVWTEEQPAWVIDVPALHAPAGEGRRARGPAERVRVRRARLHQARRDGVLHGRAPRGRRRPAGDDDQPRHADRPVRRALPGRRATARDPQRRVRLRGDDGPPRQHRRGQRGGGAHVRLHRRRDGGPRAGGGDGAAAPAGRAPPRPDSLRRRPARATSSTTRSRSRRCARTARSSRSSSPSRGPTFPARRCSAATSAT